MFLIYPMTVMVFYIFAIGICTFRTRAKAVRSGKLKLGYYRTMDAVTYPPPEEVVKFSRHYDNMFELPMLFFVTCLVCMQFQINDTVVTLAGWGFVFSRFLHSYFHLGSNNVIRRAQAFALGWFFVLVMWVMIFVSRVFVF